MDLFAIIEKFGIPVAVACAFGFFIWRQNAFIQNELMQELEQDFKRLEMIIAYLMKNVLTESLVKNIVGVLGDYLVNSSKNKLDNALWAKVKKSLQI